MYKVFRHLNDDFKGLFSFIRENKMNSSVKVNGPESYVGSYCAAGGIYAKPLECLIDGDLKSSWSNKVAGKEYEYFIIELVSSNFKLSGITLRTPCHYPATVKIDVSENGDIYQNLMNVTDLADYTTKYYPKKTAKAYRFFKFSSEFTAEDHSYYRFHMSEVEFFGVLNPNNLISCKRRSNLFNLKPSFILYIIYSY